MKAYTVDSYVSMFLSKRDEALFAFGLDCRVFVERNQVLAGRCRDLLRGVALFLFPVELVELSEVDVKQSS